MYFRYWFKSGKYYGSIVKSERFNGKVIQKTIAYIGELQEEQLPYLKAAFSKNKPKLVYQKKEDHIENEI
jgi:hypothetical protein